MSSKNRIRTYLVPTASMPESEIREAFELYAPHHNVSFEEVEARIRKNLDYLTVYRKKEDGKLVGFTGVRTKLVQLESGKKYFTFYTGFSFIEPEFRGKMLLQKAGLPLVFRHYLRHPFIPAIMWCDALSYKPYLAQARYMRDFYPNRLVETPKDLQALRDFLGDFYYGAAYDPSKGTVAKQSSRLKGHVAQIGPKEMQHPDIRFFAESNPGHAKGDGILILTPFNLRNFLTLFARLAKKALPGRKKQLQPRYATN